MSERIELNDTGLCRVSDELLELERTYAEEELKARSYLASGVITQAEYDEFVNRRLYAHEAVQIQRCRWLKDMRHRARPDPTVALRELRQSYEEDMDLSADAVPLLLVLTDVCDVLCLDRVEVLGKENVGILTEWSETMIAAVGPLPELAAATV